MPRDRRHSAGGGPALPARDFVALFGGAGSMHHEEPPQLPVLRFDIDRNGLRALLGAIASGRVAAVLILTRFVDHPSCHCIRAACQARGIPLRLARTVGAVGAAAWASLAEAATAGR